MKSLVLALTVLLSSSAFAHDLSPKEQICNDLLMKTVPPGDTLHQINAVIIILDTAYDLNLTPERSAKLQQVFMTRAEQPSGIENLGKAAYFACVTDLTAEDKQIFSSQLELLLK